MALRKKLTKLDIDSDSESSDTGLSDDSSIAEIDGNISDTIPDSESELSVASESEEEEEEDEDVCPLKYVDNSDSEESDTEILEEIFEEEKVIENMIVPNDKRITKPFLTKYERVRLTGDRTRQLASGAKPMVKNIQNMSSLEIAKLEIEKNVIPLIIERPLPNGLKERWYIHELEH